jgi:hypothetical protein
MDRTETFKQEDISGHEPQTELDTMANGLADRQLQCDFDTSISRISYNCACTNTIIIIIIIIIINSIRVYLRTNLTAQRPITKLTRVFRNTQK